MSGRRYLAHIDETTGREQSIKDHLTGTAILASRFAQPFNSGKEAYACGMLHDIGKYSDAFQKRLLGGNKTDHSTAGSQVAYKNLRDPYMAFCIAGHHAGIPDIGTKMDSESSATLWGRLKRKVENFEAYEEEIPNAVSNVPAELTSTTYDKQFYTRMLYSCLVDADFIDTEEFMSNGTIKRAKHSIDNLELKLNQYVKAYENPQGSLNRTRCEILKSVVCGAGQEEGLFTLTVPTGGGKTIASVAFALRHAALHGMRRVIYVIPYCSIIEQTQKTFETIFGKENVIAHYSNVEYDTENSKEAEQRYLAAENWDAPIVLTTAVQFFESLYSNRSSACRKLHNIVDSVLIFDEAQMMPVPYLIPCVESISALIRNYHCSAVLCTATQPSLNRLFEKQEMLPNRKAFELCPSEYSCSEVFHRVNFKMEGTLSNDELAEKINDENQVLCVVNSRQQAQDLFKELNGCNVYHLSTRMTPRDRKQKLEEIRMLLKKGEDCKVISTSLIEAGVDIDFPTVYRSFAGLDSIIQAAGRCNREGKRDPEKSIVHVFETNCKIPDLLLQNINAAKHAISDTPKIDSSECVSDYFDFLFYCLKDETALDAHQIVNECNMFNFKTVSETFHLIDSHEYTIYIETKENRDQVYKYINFGPNKELMRVLNMDSVSVPEYQFKQLADRGDVKRIDVNTGVLKNPALYSKDTGLSMLGPSDQIFII